jgi:hypothetical protein
MSNLTYEQQCNKYFAPLDEICEALINREGCAGLSLLELETLIYNNKELNDDLLKYEGYRVQSLPVPHPAFRAIDPLKAITEGLERAEDAYYAAIGRLRVHLEALLRDLSKYYPKTKIQYSAGMGLEYIEIIRLDGRPFCYHPLACGHQLYIEEANNFNWEGYYFLKRLPTNHPIHALVKYKECVDIRGYVLHFDDMTFINGERV